MSRDTSDNSQSPLIRGLTRSMEDRVSILETQNLKVKDELQNITKEMKDHQEILHDLLGDFIKDIWKRLEAIETIISIANVRSLNNEDCKKDGIIH